MTLPCPKWGRRLMGCGARVGVGLVKILLWGEGGVIAATATGGLQHGCHTTVGGLSEG